MIMVTSHKDLHGDILSLEALESLASQIGERYLPINVDHDVRTPPVGRVTKAEVIKLKDGEWGVLGTGELFEGSDTLESLAGDGRSIAIRDTDIPVMSVQYDRTFRDVEDKKILDELSRISKEEPVCILKKAYEPISTLVIAAGVFVVGSIFTGFLRKIGYDLYDRFKNALIRYYGKKKPSEQILDFCFSTRHGEKIFEVHVLVSNPSAKDMQDFFASGMKEVDTLLISLPLEKAKDIAQIVLEYRNQRLSLLYGVNRASVPITFRIRKKKCMKASLRANA